MNANEYIKVGAIVPVNNDAIKELIDFIRKQQAEIEALKAKTLTDGEILNMYLKQTNGNKDLDILEFARAILRKAQGL